MVIPTHLETNLEKMERPVADSSKVAPFKPLHSCHEHAGHMVSIFSSLSPMRRIKYIVPA